jgi:hypothetical protein
MVISDDPNYVTVLKGIAKHIKENQIESLSFGRKGIISFWIDNLNSLRKKPIGEKSVAIFTHDINHIIDKILGVEFA